MQTSNPSGAGQLKFIVADLDAGNKKDQAA